VLLKVAVRSCAHRKRALAAPRPYPSAGMPRFWPVSPRSFAPVPDPSPPPPSPPLFSLSAPASCPSSPRSAPTTYSTSSALELRRSSGRSWGKRRAAKGEGVCPSAAAALAGKPSWFPAHPHPPPIITPSLSHHHPQAYPTTLAPTHAHEHTINLHGTEHNSSSRTSLPPSPPDRLEGGAASFRYLAQSEAFALSDVDDAQEFRC
jgi:hypothetical protein